jgi:hypothetical protein
LTFRKDDHLSCRDMFKCIVRMFKLSDYAQRIRIINTTNSVSIPFSWQISIDKSLKLSSIILKFMVSIPKFTLLHIEEPIKLLIRRRDN